MKISNIKQFNNEWTFRTSDNKGVYYTNRNGEGIFFQSDRTGETRQLIGTCQFQACQTKSGMKRKLERIVTWNEDPRI